MKTLQHKILSILLIVTFSISSFGFIVEHQNCECCNSSCDITMNDSAGQSCCQVEEKLPACCADKHPVKLTNNSSCNCAEIKCAQSEYIRYDYKLLAGKLVHISFKLKNFYLVTINTIELEHTESYLDFLKYDPPPINFKNIDYIIQISKLKLPAPALV